MDAPFCQNVEKTILDRWKNLEAWLNQKLESIIQAMHNYVDGKRPKKKKTDEKKSHLTPEQQIKIFFQNTSKKISKQLQNIGYYFSLALQKVQKNLDQLVKTVSTHTKGKGFFKKMAAILGLVLLPFLVRLQKWVMSLKPVPVTIGVSLTTLLSITVFNVYQTSKKVKEEVQRTPASIEGSGRLAGSNEHARPEYYKMDERFIKILNIDVPVYVENVNSLRSVRLDFVMLPSNRYIREYLYEHEYLVQDRINVMIEPVIPELPLSDEGRTIIREKLQYEVNQLLKSIHIKGSIDEVYIDSILAN